MTEIARPESTPGHGPTTTVVVGSIDEFAVGEMRMAKVGSSLGAFSGPEL